MAKPSVTYEHQLTAVKGWMPGNMGCLDKSLPLAAAINFDVPAGRCVHIDSDKRFSLGCHASSVPGWLLANSTDADVSNPGETDGGVFVHQTVIPGDNPNHTALMEGGGYELSTTEFNASRTYAPGDMLTADTGNTDSTNGGLMDNRNAANAVLTVPYFDSGTTTQVCGIVSEGVKTNENNISVLLFYPKFFPAAA